MKKLITIVAALLLSVNFLNAQTSDVYVIDQTTCDTIKSDVQTLYFDGGFTLNMAGRGRKACVDKFGTWTVGINFKNNAFYSITIPTGMKVYRIEICGLSQGDNWEYLAAWGVGDNMLDGVGYEFVDPIGKGVKDNATIKTAKYPIDPCSGDAVYLSDKTDPSVPFAILDFGNEPYEGDFPFYGSGNNQYDLAFKLYTSRSAADAAATAIRQLEADKHVCNNAIYNLKGQRVSTSYKGLVIRNGKKELLK